MLSTKLMHLIADHREQLANAAVLRIRHDPELSHMGRFAESELRDWALGILTVLQSSRTAALGEEFTRRYRRVGRRRFEEAIPLHEVIRCLQILKGTNSGSRVPRNAQRRFRRRCAPGCPALKHPAALRRAAAWTWSRKGTR